MGKQACPSWKEHVWEERANGLFYCIKCPFVKSFGELAYADCLGWGKMRIKSRYKPPLPPPPED